MLDGIRSEAIPLRGSTENNSDCRAQLFFYGILIGILFVSAAAVTIILQHNQSSELGPSPLPIPTPPVPSTEAYLVQSILNWCNGKITNQTTTLIVPLLDLLTRNTTVLQNIFYGLVDQLTSTSVPTNGACTYFVADNTCQTAPCNETRETDRVFANITEAKCYFVMNLFANLTRICQPMNVTPVNLSGCGFDKQYSQVSCI